MWDRKRSKEIGKERFKQNYWRSVLTAFLLVICAGTLSCGSPSNSTSNADVPESTEQIGDVSSMITPEMLGIGAALLIGLTITGLIIKIFILNPLSVGCYGFFRDNIDMDGRDLGVLKAGFSDYKHSLLTLLLRDVYLTLWTLLLIIPGIIKSYSYRMVPFIVRDNPELSASEAITKSRRMMDGHKWDMFVFDLSYIGWFLLGCITLGIVNVLWTEPYRQSANADIYLKLANNTQVNELA